MTHFRTSLRVAAVITLIIAAVLIFTGHTPAAARELVALASRQFGRFGHFA